MLGEPIFCAGIKEASGMRRPAALRRAGGSCDARPVVERTDLTMHEECHLRGITRVSAGAPAQRPLLRSRWAPRPNRPARAALRGRAVCVAAAACCAAIGLLAVAEQAHAAIAFVKNVGQASCSGTTSMTVTVPTGGVVAGDTLVVRLMLRGTTSAAVTASDSRGNTYTVDKDQLNSDQRIVVFSANVATSLAAGDTITVTYPSANSQGVVVDEFSGVAASERVDATGSASGNSTTPSASVTTTNASDLLIGAVSIANTQTVTQPAAWTGLTTQSLSCGNSTNIGAYKPVSATGTYTYNPTVSNGSRWAAGVVAYKAAAITNTLEWAVTPGNLSFAATLNGKDQAPTSTLALDVGDGTLTAGWNITLTSTTLSTGGGSPHTLSTTATTVQTAPTDTCDSICTAATNSITYPYTVPAGSTAPAATKLYDAAAATGVGNQTVTPTFTLALPAKTYAGTYASTWTVTLASGP
jgi:hypothetical protein